MTKTINIADAKAQLSALVDRAAAGEEIVLSRAGRPVARLMPLAERLPRQPGVCRSWQIPEELFLEPADPDDLRAAEGIDADALGISTRR
jgi:prevent-host-death family protein